MQYDEVTQKTAALERAKKKMSTELKLMMGDERELPLAQGSVTDRHENANYPGLADHLVAVGE